MALNQTYLNLVEIEQKIMHAGRIPYKNFMVSDSALHPSPTPTPEISG